MKQGELHIEHWKICVKNFNCKSQFINTWIITTCRLTYKTSSKNMDIYSCITSYYYLGMLTDFASSYIYRKKLSFNHSSTWLILSQHWDKRLNKQAVFLLWFTVQGSHCSASHKQSQSFLIISINNSLTIARNKIGLSCL